MSQDERSTLIAGMDDRRQKASALINSLDSSLIVHPATGWTLKDLVGHLAAWEAAAADCIETANRGEIFTNDDHDSLGTDGYNTKLYDQRRDWPMTAILQEWAEQRARLQAAILARPAADWDTLLVPPWGGNQAVATAEQIAKGMGAHEKRHLHEIESASQLMNE